MLHGPQSMSYDPKTGLWLIERVSCSLAHGTCSSADRTCETDVLQKPFGEFIKFVDMVIGLLRSYLGRTYRHQHAFEVVVKCSHFAFTVLCSCRAFSFCGEIAKTLGPGQRHRKERLEIPP